ncbi:hypothetical protein JGH11_16220 [Dysgonomonas sp. Marseille-P4677]|uniref:hypothetical protein n=1 Tax=Dysgonomonas sp. Marseille-P4677 TaxID=2364790 RepID=UPI00191277E9|nr:hypothetical protein [Dysgonomonas sp. Marseille-P4677]MBK5722423.1 hypothetical protein [Dysgonomonas sp. Marseille-P4677]
MSTIEQQVNDILSNRKYSLNIAGENVTFRMATLQDLEDISAIVSELPIFKEIIQNEDNSSEETWQIIDAFKYAKKLGDIIKITVDPDINIELDRDKVKGTLLKTKDQIYQEKYNDLYDKLYKQEIKRINDLIYRKANIMDVWVTVQLILKNNHVFFYQNTITFLKGMNLLKPTKETEVIVRGQ